MPGGSEALVCAARTTAGREVVIKLWLPEVETMAGETATLVAAQGRGYAAVLRFDTARDAMMLERLGPALGTLGLPVEAQMTHLCTALHEAWQAPVDGSGLQTGAEKAAWLDRWITTWDRELGGVISPALRSRIGEAAAERARAFDPKSAVLVHGDGHEMNLLQVPGEPDRFKFIDPDGLLAEPAYDLGILMRGWSDELRDGDTPARALARCRFLAERTGVDALAIWQWGLLERVSTGLYLRHLGFEAEGAIMLQVAEALAGSSGP